MKELFTLKEMSKYTGYEVDMLRARARKLNIPVNLRRTFDNKSRERVFTMEEFNTLRQGKVSKEIIVPEVIYVTRTFEIYESKLNYTELTKL